MHVLAFAALALVVQVVVEPVQNFAIPQPLVGRFAYPVTFIRKDYQFAWYVLALQRREERDALGNWYPVIQFTVHDELRRLEIGREEVRRPDAILRLHRLLIPILSAKLVLGKPHLLRAASRCFKIPYPIVGEQRLEAVRVPGDPVDHVATVRRAGRADPRRVHPRNIARHCRVKSLHQITVWCATPVTRHLVGKFLTVTRRAMRVDEHDRETARREQGEVPARMPGIEKWRLRSAMNYQQHRKFLARLVLRRPDDDSLDTVAELTLEPEILARIQLQLGDQRVVLASHSA